MEHISLDLTKYKRFFAFGCSFTDYHWPTWADIIGGEFPDQYFNFGNTGSSNDFIFRSVIEANQIHNFQPDDLIIIQWTEFLRDAGWRPDSGLSGCGSILQNHQYTIYTEEHFQKLDPREFIKRDLEYIKTTTTFLKHCNVDYFMFSMNDATNPDGAYIRPDLGPLIDFYQDVVDELFPSFEETVRWAEQPGVKTSQHEWPDTHPSPAMHLTHLLTIFPNMKIKDETVDLVNNVENKLRNNKVIDIFPMFTKIKAPRWPWHRSS